MSKRQLADTVGLGREAVYNLARAHRTGDPERITEMLEIVSRISAWAGGHQAGDEVVPGTADRRLRRPTAESLVKSGDAAALRDYLDHV